MSVEHCQCITIKKIVRNILYNALSYKSCFQRIVNDMGNGNFLKLWYCIHNICYPMVPKCYYFKHLSWQFCGIKHMSVVLQPSPLHLQTSSQTAATHSTPALISRPQALETTILLPTSLDWTALVSPSAKSYSLSFCY